MISNLVVGHHLKELNLTSLPFMLRATANEMGHCDKIRCSDAGI